MSDKEAVASTMEARSKVPTNQLPPSELKALMPAPVAPADNAAVEPAAVVWADGTETGAFISRAASTRFEVNPYRWYQISWSIVVLYGVFIGLPVVAGVWAVWVIGSRVGWWG
jgi:hypothetical protein